MFKYLVKNLKSLLTKQGVISLLLVVNIVVSALVICFSYGLYQNYNVILEDGKSDVAEKMYIEIKPQFLSTNPIEPLTSEVTLDMMTEFIYSLSDNTANRISGIIFDVAYENDVYRYPDKDTGYYTQMFRVIRRNGKIVESDFVKMFDDEYYINADKVVIVGNELFEGSNESEMYSYSFSSMASTGGSQYEVIADTFIPKGTESLIINNETYKIIKKIEHDSYLYVPLTSLSLSSKLSTHYIEIYFGEKIDSRIYMDICECANNSMGPYVQVQPLEFESVSEIYYYKTIILISVIIAILAAINMAILYRYILEKRSSELAILRICGCSKAKAVTSYLIECMIINAPLFALTQLCYHKLIMPKLTGLFPHMEGAYSFKLYAAIFGIYVVASLVVMLIMIISTIRKHSLVEQKNSAKAKTRFGIMKIFEVLQLTTVVSIVVCIVSAIMSRYQYYTPFERYLEREGYMLTVNGYSLYEDDFKAMLPPSAECILNTAPGATDGEIYLNGTGYSDEFIDAYKPPMENGIWLSETTDTFENSGYIPIVISYCDGKYKVGDVIENDIVLSYDEDGNPLKSVHAKYKVIGITKDNVYIPSKYLTEHDSTSLKVENHMDIYDFFNDDFDENYYMFVRKSDERACYGMDNVIHGTQFVFCEGMLDEEYKELGETLKKKQNVFVAPLSEVNENSLNYIYEQMYTLFPIALCIFILTVISAVSINAIYTKRQLRNYAIFYICGARWKTCALKSLKDSAITCAVASALCALILFIGKQSFLKETVISFGIWHAVICVAVIALYLILSMIMPIAIIGSSQPKDVLKEE